MDEYAQKGLDQFRELIAQHGGDPSKLSRLVRRDSMVGNSDDLVEQTPIEWHEPENLD